MPEAPARVRLVPHTARLLQPRPFLNLLAAFLLAAGLGCASSKTPESAPPDDAQPPPAKVQTKSLNPGIVLTDFVLGTWVLIDQQSLTRRGGLRWDKMRELTFHEDGSYRLNLGYREKSDRYELAKGAIRLHETLREGVDMVSAPAPEDPAKLKDWRPAEVRHVNELRIVSLTTDRLVVEEDDPHMVFGNHLPPGKIRNTYRRKLEGDFGPLLGARQVRFVPAAGRFAAKYSFSQHKLPTMEMSVNSGSSGTAVLELNTDGSARLCAGVQVHSSFSASRYAPGGERSSSDTRKTLIAAGGRWVTLRGTAAVRFDKMVWNTCDLAAPSAYPLAQPTEMTCTGLHKNDALPVDALACRLDARLSQLHDLAFNPADSYRAGPYNLQTEPMGHIRTEPGLPWLILGAEPGLRIDAEDARDSGSPVVKLTGARVVMNEKDYIKEPVR